MRTLPLHDDLHKDMMAELHQLEQETDLVKQAVAGAYIVVEYLKRLKASVICLTEVDKQTEIQMFKEIKPYFACWFFHYRDRYQLHKGRKPGSEQPYKKAIKKLMRRMKRSHKRNYDFYTYCRVGHTHLDEQYFMRSSYDWKLNVDPNGALTDCSFYTYYDQKLARMLAYDETERYVMNLQGLQSPTGERSRLNKYTWTAAKTWLKEMVYGCRAAKAVNNGQAKIDELARDLGAFFNVNLDDIYTFPRDMKRHTKSPTPGLDEMRHSIVSYLERNEELD